MKTLWTTPAQGLNNNNTRSLLCTDVEEGFMRAVRDQEALDSLTSISPGIKDGVISVWTSPDDDPASLQPAALDGIVANLHTKAIDFADLVWEVEEYGLYDWLIHVGLASDLVDPPSWTGPHALTIYQILWGDSVIATVPGCDFEEWIMRSAGDVLPDSGGPLLCTFGLDDYYATEAEANARKTYFQNLFEGKYDPHELARAEPVVVAGAKGARRRGR
jgi:hypothetical protein